MTIALPERPLRDAHHRNHDYTDFRSANVAFA